MNINFELSVPQVAALQFAADGFNAEQLAALSEDKRQAYQPVTAEAYLRARINDTVQSYVSQKAEVDLKRVNAALKANVDTGEFLAKLADAAEKAPEALVQILQPALDATTPQTP